VARVLEPLVEGFEGNARAEMRRRDGERLKNRRREN
jgi:hypothetical protein